MVTQAAIMFAAGIGIPLLAALNARLGANIGSPRRRRRSCSSWRSWRPAPRCS
jgi:uncharacterized membrane protein YdcZ (DUF606 family)